LSSGTILVESAEHSTLFSKGILAQSLTAAGIDEASANRIARNIEAHLLAEGRNRVKRREIRELARANIEALVGEAGAKRYLTWRHVQHGREPMVILISGATGVGKSTAAAQLAHRLGIMHVMGTDAVREVMRKIISAELMPTLHLSSYTSWRAVKEQTTAVGEPTIAGFEDHAKYVLVGVEAIIERALKEGQSIIIEGVHIVPGFLKKEIMSRPNVVLVVITASDDEEHRNRMYSRSENVVTRRPVESYLKEMPRIRAIQGYLVSRAKEEGVPIIENQNIERTVNEVFEEVMKHAREIVFGKGGSGED
jgi:2-phosphoglycerate kinase